MKAKTKFVPQSDASKKASNESFKRFALGPMTDLYKKQQAEAAKKTRRVSGK